MSMDQRQFEALVQRMERFAVRAPGTYRSWVLALALFGYTLLLALVIVLLLLLALLAFGLRDAAWLSVKLGLVVGALLLVVLRSLWVRLEPPTGEPLARQEAPAFFARLDRLVAGLHTPRVHRVLVTEDFNAAVMQLPRLGIFGWYRNYLLIGLPLMQCLSGPQFEAVLAHELGHLSRGHARLGNWIYRLRRVWMRLDSALAQRPQREPAAAFVRRGCPALAGPGAGGTDHLCRHTSVAPGAARSHEGGRTVRAARGRLGRG